MRNRMFAALCVLVLVSMILGACGPAATPTKLPAQPTTAPTAPPAQPTAAPTTPPPTQPPAPKKGGTVTIGVNQAPPTLDPHASPSAITFYMLSSAGESLLYLTPDRQLKPWLAESWEVSADAKVYTFRLRKDVTFQDGTPFNAQAVKWNFDRITSPDFKAGAAAGLVAGYDHAEVVDEYTVRIFFKNGYMPFLTNAASPVLSMISPTATQQQGAKVNETPVTTGPYRLTELVANDHATMERWDGYDRQPPWADHIGPGYVERIIWKFIPESGTRVATVESGECQVIADVPYSDLPRLEASKDITIQRAAWVGSPLQWLLNVTKPPTDDVRVRKALNFAINRQALADTIYRGTGRPPVGIVTAALLDVPLLPSYYPYDPDRARQLLAEAGWNRTDADGFLVNETGKRLEIQINSIDYGTGPREIDQWVQAQLQAIGIAVTLKAQARPPWYEDNYACATNGPIMLYRFGDPDSLQALFHSQNVGGFANWSCVKDPELDRLIEQARVETDAQRRTQLYVDLSKRVLENAYIVPLVDELSVWALRNEVTGLKFNGFTYPVAADLYFIQ